MFFLVLATMAALARGPGQEPGQLEVVGKGVPSGQFCPLKHTTVNADIAGFGARVNVSQTFSNSSATPIEAIYTFPLPHDSAVDQMRIRVGKRVIDGTIKRKEEAKRIYEAARDAGQTAGLLDQERPNIFTQSVANIMPGASVQVEISYVQILKYEGGQFEFNYPMVVGPRYLGNAQDPEKIAPPITAKGTRTGSTIDLNVRLDAGAPIENMASVLHKISVNREDDRRAKISLLKEDEIPNRDFILRYQTATDKVQSAFVTCYDGKKGGFFDLILLPPKAPRAADISPREMIFVMDQSGSQSGFPIQKSKELTYKLLKTMRPGDTFNVYGFNTEVRSLWRHPQTYTPEHLAQAHRFLDVMEANGGTNLLEGLKAALTVPKDPERLRVVLFNTDGYVGDETNILKEIKRDRDSTRIFTFGIGNSVNRYLIDAMSIEGKGDSEMVTLAESASDAADRFVQKLRAPVLTDVKVTTDGVELTDMLPREIPDVFSDRPIMVQGRYDNPGHGSVTVSGRVGGRPWSKTLNLAFPAESGDSCVATLWARKKVDDLTDRSFESAFIPDVDKSIEFPTRITDVALQFGIMSQYTSFVAVEPRIVNIDGMPVTVHVPVEMADGVSYEGIMGNLQNRNISTLSSTNASLSFGLSAQGRSGSGGASFGGGGFAGSRAASSGQSKITRSIGGRRQASESLPDKDESRTYESIVDQRLRTPSGKVLVMIFIDTYSADLVSKLKALGFSVAEVDKKLRIVFGTCDAKILKKLAAMTEVTHISPIE